MIVKIIILIFPSRSCRGRRRARYYRRYDDLTRWKARRCMGGVWPKQVSTPTRPLTRCYVALRRRYSHVSHREPPEGSDLLSAEIGVSARPRFALVFSRDWSSLGAKGTGEKLSPTWPTRTGGIWKSWDSMGGARQRVGTSILETASLSCVCKFSPGETSVTTFMRWTKSFLSLLSKSWSYK